MLFFFSPKSIHLTLNVFFLVCCHIFLSYFLSQCFRAQEIFFQSWKSGQRRVQNDSPWRGAGVAEAHWWPGSFCSCWWHASTWQPEPLLLPSLPPSEPTLISWQSGEGMQLHFMTVTCKGCFFLKKKKKVLPKHRVRISAYKTHLNNGTHKNFPSFHSRKDWHSLLAIQDGKSYMVTLHMGGCGDMWEIKPVSDTAPASRETSPLFHCAPGAGMWSIQSLQVISSSSKHSIYQKASCVS